MGFKKYPKVRRPGHPETDGLLADPDDSLIITEKIDGNNFRVTRDGDQLRFGSRNCDLGTDLDEVGGMFEDVAEYLVAELHPADLHSLEKALGVESVVLFGENAVEHTIDDYRWEEVPQFQLFDIWVAEAGGGYWLPFDRVVTHAEKLGLETVPVVDRTTVDAFDPAEYSIPASAYRPGDRPAEGVVVRNQVSGVKAKMISEEFAEKHKSAKSKSNYDVDEDHQQFLANHVTRRRVEKNVEKLIDSPEHDYEAPVMEMMEVLATQVWNDVWEEDWNDIIYENWELDMGDLRSSTSSKTANILRDLMKSHTVVDAGTGETAGEHLDVEGDD